MTHRVVGADMASMCSRVKARRKDYIAYDFTRKKNDILKTFFDLAQEYETLRDFYRICVAVPWEFMGVESRLYLLDDKGQNLRLVCDSCEGVIEGQRSLPDNIYLNEVPYENEGAFVVPIIRRRFQDREFAILQSQSSLLGMFEINPAKKLSASDRFFFTKYTNRIAYNLYNRILDRQHINHLRFINNLVLDIEHNVIVPNMYFKYLFRQLRKKIGAMEELEHGMTELLERGEKDLESCRTIQTTIASLQKDMDQYLMEVEKHHNHLSLFIESLFRRDHFEKGHLVLRTRNCLVEKEIILPQLDHYRQRLQARNITVEKPQDMQEEEIALVVDVGLLSQVYDNFFSNAVKYTEEIIDPKSGSRKVLAYGRQHLPDYFGVGKDGIKFNVFTTGRHIDENENKTLFESGFRCSRDKKLPGTGHGLSFIKNVIEIHAGQVGYEATEHGNNFYFILPLLPEPFPENPYV